MPVRLGVWSGPRNISTALMRAWENRPDTWVVDEPLYGHYLRVSGAPHPGAEEVMAHMSPDAAQVIEKVKPAGHALELAQALKDLKAA